MARTVYNTENGLIIVDPREEEIRIVTDNDTIVRISIFSDRVIISSNKELIKTDNSPNILIR
jgi:hypothetical protein